MKRFFVALCILFCVMAHSRTAYAAFNSHPLLPTLIDEADVACIVKIGDIRTLGQIKIEVTPKDQNGNAVTIDAQKAIADVTVESFLKGKAASSSFQVTFLKNVHTPGSGNPQLFTELISGEKDVIFLTSTTDKAVFAMTEPASNGKSKISLGVTNITAPPSNLSPLRATVLALTEALQGNSKPVVLDCLQRLQSTGYLLYAKPDFYSDEVAVQRRLALTEPLLTETTSASSLEAFVTKEILPAVTRLTKDRDVKISEEATITAGRLQDVSVIPNLIKISSKDTDPDVLGLAASTIGNYKNPKAIVPLIEALDSSSSKVREQAIYSLRELNNPLALPFLIESLNDGASSVRFAVNQALFAITGEVGSHLPQGNEQSLQSRENTFWKNWALKHQYELKKYRAEFNSITQAVVP